MTPTGKLATVWKQASNALAQRLLLERPLAFWLGELDRSRSLTDLRARVLDVVSESHDTKTFVLRPNSQWRGHRAGQYLTVAVEIDGVYARRCYSISSCPGDARLAITVKRVPGGLVSNWLHDHVRSGDVLRLGAADGDFILPEPVPAKLLLLSGGSGMTPVMSMLRALANRGAISDIVFVHYARSRADVIFASTLEALARRHPGLRVELILDDDRSGPGGFDAVHLARLVPDFARRMTFLCGPAGLMERVAAMWQGAGAAAQLRLERFVAATQIPRSTQPQADGEPDLQLQLTRSRRSFAVTGSATLLEQLEQAGERPAHGCRIGICHTCKCHKQTGTVQNVLTGAISSLPDEEIQLCISVPRSDVQLRL